MPYLKRYRAGWWNRCAVFSFVSLLQARQTGYSALSVGVAAVRPLRLRGYTAACSLNAGHYSIFPADCHDFFGGGGAPGGTGSSLPSLSPAEQGAIHKDAPVFSLFSTISVPLPLLRIQREAQCRARRTADKYWNPHRRQYRGSEPNCNRLPLGHPESHPFSSRRVSRTSSPARTETSVRSLLTLRSRRRHPCAPCSQALNRRHSYSAAPARRQTGCSSSTPPSCRPQPSPTSAAPRMNAPCRTSVSAPMMAGAPI